MIELKFTSHNSPEVPLSKYHKQWGDMLEERSGGRVKVTEYWSESLLKTSEVYRGTQTGITDIGYYVVGTDPGLTELNRFQRLPFLGLPSMEIGTEIYKQIWDKFPEVRAEFKEMKAFGQRMMPPYQLHTVKGVVRVPSDLKGKKIIARAEWATVMQNVGAAPLDQGPGDWYMTLERGLGEGHFVHFPAIMALKTLELLPYHTIFGDGGCGMAMDMWLMNEDTWNSLPPDVQQIINDLEPWLKKTEIEQEYSYINMILDTARKMNHTFTNLTPEEIALWKDAAKVTHQDWINKNASRGAQQIYDEVMRLEKELTK
ncbi:MAG TPA: TRAP transporter substrate-binding protein DctP [Dehalococcoidales bacterium]|nr:TRAP transporter substrate-binding protein DctP [Dehalococcoidales bacterium]